VRLQLLAAVEFGTAPPIVPAIIEATTLYPLGMSPANAPWNTGGQTRRPSRNTPVIL
jgi:hypothetical protein